MGTVANIAAFLDVFAPRELAAEWDNVGLLLGSRAGTVQRLMTCLTLTPETVEEAVQCRADMVVVHHPLPFRPLHTVTDDTLAGRLLWQLARAGASVYSPHTAFDSCAGGINEQLALGIGIAIAGPLVPGPIGMTEVGTGRFGTLAKPLTLEELAAKTKAFLRVAQVQIVRASTQPLERVGVACGSAAEFFAAAAENQCQALVTGEARFHTCLEARAAGVSLIVAGHFPTERFAVEKLAQIIAQEFSSLDVWCSQHERDPLEWM